MIATLRNRNFALLWAAGLVSSLGDWLMFIALPFYIYDLTGSALATGAMFIAQTLPGIALGSVAGVFADRWDRRRTLIVSDLLRALVVLLILLIHRAELVWLVYLAVCVESVVGQFFEPAKNALIPRLVPEGQLVSANALSSLSFELTRLAGPPLGGLLLGLSGINGVVLLDSGSYILSALLLLLMRAPAGATATVQPAPERASPWRSVWGELVAGLRLIRGERWITTLFVVMGIVMVGQGILNVMLVPFVNNVLGVGAREFAWIVTAQAVGGLTGGLLVGQVGRWVAPGRLIMLSSLLLGAIILLIAAVPVLWVVVALCALAGWPAVGLFVSVPTLLQSAVPDQFRGRMFGAFHTVQSLLMLCGLGLASLLGDRVPVLVLMGSVGALYGLAALVAALFLGGAPLGIAEQVAAPGGG